MSGGGGVSSWYGDLAAVHVQHQLQTSLIEERGEPRMSYLTSMTCEK